jgi:alpha-tubulin suppressor-like RCC1 family protein
VWQVSLAGVAAASLLLALAPRADARSTRNWLSLPSSASTGARVQASGRVGRSRHRRRVVLQQRKGRRWTTLAAARVSHGRFKAAFTAPSRPGVLIVRAVLYRSRHRIRVSASRKLVIHAPPAPAPAPLPPPAPGPGLVAWGKNGSWELGADFKNGYSTIPVPVLGLPPIKAVAATYFTSYALLRDGTVRSWGGNVLGQLGDGARGASSPKPVTVTGLSGVSALAAGGAHAMALLSDGTVATWGGDAWGELGNGTTGKGNTGTGSDVPLIVPGLHDVLAIAAGGADDAALLRNGTVVAWGENKLGQLGDGTTVEKDVPTPVLGLVGVKAIALGGDPSLGGHMLVLLNDGTVRAIGGNGLGQLGNGSTTNSTSPVVVKGLSGVRAVSAAVSHSMALLENGSVVTWGVNDHGELGVGPGPEKCAQALLACSRVPVAVGLTNVSAISAGFRFSVALSEGRPYAWGWNEAGELGDGTTTDRFLPVPVSGLSEVTAIAAGEHHTLALTEPAALLHADSPSIPIELVAGVGSLTVNWKASEAGERWTLTWRAVAHPAVKWGKYVGLPPATRSYTISGLSAVPYEVRVSNKGFGSKIVTGTPLA